MVCGRCGGYYVSFDERKDRVKTHRPVSERRNTAYKSQKGGATKTSSADSFSSLRNTTGLCLISTKGVINGVFREGKVRLPLRYNVQAPIFAIHGYRDLVNYYSLPAFYDARSVDEAIHNPAIVHFTSFFLERPWFRFCLHPLKHLYRHTLRHTPYAQSQLQVNKSGLVNILKDLCFKYFQPLYLWIR